VRARLLGSSSTADAELLAGLMLGSDLSQRASAHRAGVLLLGPSEPRMAECFGSGHSTTGLWLQQSADKLLRQIGQAAPSIRWEFRLGLTNLAVQVMQTFGLEGQLPAEQQKAEHAQTPAVHRKRVGTFVNQFGGHEGRRAAQSHQKLAVGQSTGKAKVANLLRRGDRRTKVEVSGKWARGAGEGD
jgi:hypothetical protein